VDEYKLFWGDSHANLHARHVPHLDVTLKHARQVLDFLPMAYYPQEKQTWSGFAVEDLLPAEQLDEQWKTICRFAEQNNQPGELVIFPGYEWQGDGTSGDHNVFFLEDNPPMLIPDTLDALYAELHQRGLSAFAIPHHTAYMPGVRSKDWSVHDPQISPFAEIFSFHGCSESDEEWIGLRRNPHMGPGVSGGTIEDGLDLGRKFGIIASNDGHDGLPGHWGWGLMGCYAKELTRRSLWEAFASRRVYGVTGDRMELHFAVEGAPMGEAIRKQGPVRIGARVHGCDAIDRIELLRNNRVIATHCHNGTWAPPAPQQRVRCKLRIEVGWGGRSDLLPDFPPRDWKCRIDVPDGSILDAEKCWQGSGNWIGQLGGSSCQFGFHTRTQGRPGEGLNTEATIFEIDARPQDALRLNVEGKDQALTVGEAMSGSRIISFADEAARYVRKAHGLDPDALPRFDRLYYTGHKCKVHRAIPDAGLVAALEHTDPDPPRGENHYRVRVTQRNGQVAWSSPVWVEN